MITIRAHCIPSYDELCRMRKVSPIPQELDSLEEETAGGIITKLKTIVDSDYFANLPNTAIIQSGAISNFEWSKKAAKEEAYRIFNECKEFLN